MEMLFVVVTSWLAPLFFIAGFYFAKHTEKIEAPAEEELGGYVTPKAKFKTFTPGFDDEEAS